MSARRFRYTSAAEARADAARMQELRDDEVTGLRQQGKEAAADKASDRWNEEIRHAEAEAAAHEAKVVPITRKRKPKTVKRQAVKRPAPAASGRGRSHRAGQGPRELASTIATRSGVSSEAASWGELAWQAFGVMIGIAILTLLVSKRGSDAAGGIFGALAGLVRLVVEPVDPLAPGAAKSALATAAPIGHAPVPPGVFAPSPVPNLTPARLVPRRGLQAGAFA